MQVTRSASERGLGDLSMASFSKNITGDHKLSADGTDRRRMHAAQHVVIAYSDRAEYEEGRARWRAYQDEVLHARLDHRTGQRPPLDTEYRPPPSFLSEVFDMFNPLDPINACRRSSTATSGPSSAPTAGRCRSSRHHQGVLLRLADPDERYTAVRLRSDLPRRASSRRDDGEWTLELARAGRRRGSSTSSRSCDGDGGTRVRLRPGQPAARARRVRREVGARCCPATSRPAWLDAEAGRRAPLRARRTAARARRERRRRRSGAPRTPSPREPLPLLRRPRRAGVRRARRPHALHRRHDRAPATLPPAPRRAARPRATATSGTRPRRATRGALVPRRAAGARATEVAVDGGRSAWAPASARWRCCTPSAGTPARFGALFLQSGSFFIPRFDAQERRFPRYHRIVALRRARCCAAAGTAAPVPAVLTCGAAEENIAQQPRDGARAAAQGYDAAARGARHAQLHGLARRVRPAPDAAARGGRGERTPRRAVLAGDRRQRRRSSPTATGAGRCSSFPAEGGSAWDFEDQRHGRRGRRADRRRPREALLRRLLRRRVVVEPRRCRSRSARARTSRYESWIARPGRAVDPRRLRRRAGDRHARRQPRRLPRRQLRAPARRPVPARARLLRQLRPGRPGTRWGERGEAAYFNNPIDYARAHAAATTSTGCAAGVSLLLVCGQGQWEDTTGVAAEHQAPRAACSREGHPARAGPLGPRRPARLAVLARTARPSSATVLLMDDADAPDRAAARHRGGLADRVRDARLAGSARSRTPRHHAPRHHRADHDGAVRPARQAALRPRRRPARLLVLPPARVAEEGRADGRRVPAQQPVHVPVDGEARGLLRDAAARAEGPADRARPAQEPARQRALRLHGGEVQPAVRPRRDRRARSATRCS